MTEADDGYSSSAYNSDDLIKYLHGFYHYGGHNEFKKNREYQEALAVLGGGIITIGLIGLLVYFVFLCCRSGCACCRKEAGCGPNLSRFILFVLSVGMCLLVLCSYVGYGTFIDGSEAIVSDCTSIKDTMIELDDYAGVMNTEGATFVAQAAKTKCWSAGQAVLTPSAASYRLVAELYQAALPPPKSISSFINIFDEQVPGYVGYLLGFAAGLAVLTSLTATLGIACKSSGILNLSSLLSIFLYLLLILLVALELTLSVMFADFCHYGPNAAIQDMANRQFSGEARDTVAFYTTCTGTNPLDTHLGTAVRELDSIHSVLAQVNSGSNSNTTCAEYGAIGVISKTYTAGVETTAMMAGPVDDTDANFPGAYKGQSCQGINEPYVHLVETALCSEAVTGLWELWSVHLAAACVLYICMFFTSHVKQKCKVLVLMDEEGAVKAIPLGPPLSPKTI